MPRDLLTEELKRAQSYLFYALREDEAKIRRTEERDWLKEWLLEHGEPDEKGNLLYEFPEPAAVEYDKVYKGLMLQRRVSEFTNEERARKLIWDKGLTSRCIRVYDVSEIDLDELYAANQEGMISDDEIDSIIDVEENWSLVKVKA